MTSIVHFHSIQGKRQYTHRGERTTEALVEFARRSYGFSTAPCKAPCLAPCRTPCLAPCSAPFLAPCRIPCLAPCRIPCLAPCSAPYLASCLAPCIAPCPSSIISLAILSSYHISILIIVLYYSSFVHLSESLMSHY